MVGREDVAFFAESCLSVAVPASGVRVIGSGKPTIADATVKCDIRGDGFRGFMLLSSKSHPGLVDRAVRNIGRVRAALPGELAETVLQPLATGLIDGRSAAIWPWHRPLIEENGRLYRRAQMLWHRRRLLDWCYDLLEQSLVETKSNNLASHAFVAPLERMVTGTEFAEPLRVDARRALDRLEGGRWKRLFTCVQHGDLWLGNFLSSGRPGHGIYAIDWAGAQAEGYPVFDLARLTESLGVRPGRLPRIARRFAERLDCDPEDLVGYALSSLGELSGRLECFPPARFHAMAARVHAQSRALAGPSPYFA